MGSQAMQGQLWGKQPGDWSSIQEKTGIAGYEFVLSNLKPGAADKILDVGCGSGIFSDLAQQKGATVTGIDASQPLIDVARNRNKHVTFMTGEMEELPFQNNSFTIVCGFNSFQYAASVKNALTEAYRVLAVGGKFAAMIWGQKEACEAATYLKAIGSLLPPPPPGAPGPFALTDNNLLETILTEVGFSSISGTDIPSTWDYESTEVAMKGLLSAGPAARAVDTSGYEKAYETVLAAIQPFVQANGHVVFHNRFRVVFAHK